MWAIASQDVFLWYWLACNSHSSFFLLLWQSVLSDPALLPFRVPQRLRYATLCGGPTIEFDGSGGRHCCFLFGFVPSSPGVISRTRPSPSFLGETVPAWLARPGRTLGDAIDQLLFVSLHVHHEDAQFEGCSFATEGCL